MFLRAYEGLRVRLVQRWPENVLHAPRLTQPLATLSFDDWPQSAWLTAREILRSRGVKATYFTSGALRGTPAGAERHFGEDELREAWSEGHEIGCHTFSHSDCREMSVAELEADLEKNADFIRRATGGSSPTSFAFPYGAASLAAKRVVASRFLSARGIQQQTNHNRFDLAQLSAFGLERYRGTLFVTQAIQDTVAAGGWLSVFTHDVRPDPSPYGCTPDELARFIDEAQAAGLVFVTQRDGAQTIIDASSRSH